MNKLDTRVNRLESAFGADSELKQFGWAIYLEDESGHQRTEFSFSANYSTREREIVQRVEPIRLMRAEIKLLLASLDGQAKLIAPQMQ